MTTGLTGNAGKWFSSRMKGVSMRTTSLHRVITLLCIAGAGCTGQLDEDLVLDQDQDSTKEISEAQQKGGPPSDPGGGPPSDPGGGPPGLDCSCVSCWDLDGDEL